MCSWESMSSGKAFLLDFNRCPKEELLLSQVLWVNSINCILSSFSYHSIQTAGGQEDKFQPLSIHRMKSQGASDIKIHSQHMQFLPINAQRPRLAIYTAECSGYCRPYGRMQLSAFAPCTPQSEATSSAIFYAAAWLGSPLLQLKTKIRGRQ